MTRENQPQSIGTTEIVKSTTLLLSVALAAACDPQTKLAAASAVAEAEAPAQTATPATVAEKSAPQPTTTTSSPAPTVAASAPTASAAIVGANAALPAVQHVPAVERAGDGRIVAEVGEAQRNPPSITPSAVVNGLSVTVHRYVNPPRTADAKENYWTQFQAWGEITNHSEQTFESVSGRIVYFDEAGEMIGVESIASLSQQDAGDHSPGETVHGEVGFVAPGESAPFHVLRNLDAIKGQVAAFAIYPRRGIPAGAEMPRGVAVDVKDALEGEGALQVRSLRGTIRNDGKAPCRDPSFVVALLDDAGRIGAVDSTMASDDIRKALGPGETVTFDGRVHLYDDNKWKATAKLRTWVDCKVPY